jgi:O-antigen/teichoic acid export membrane protein
MSSLERKVVSGIGWMVLVKLGQRGLGAISTIILARVLVPEDFGLVAMAMSVIAMIELLRAFNFDTVLIQKQNATRSDYDTIWTLNLLFSVVVAGVIVGAAAPAADYYGDPRLEPIIQALALTSLLAGFENVGAVAFQKELQFNKEFSFLLGKKLIGFAVTIPLAVIYESYWALIAGVIATNAGGIVLSYAMQPYRPRPCLRAASELLHFSKWLFFNNFLFFVRNRGVDFIVGKLAGAHALGVLALSYEVSSIPTTELVQAVNRAVFPGYAKLSAEIRALRENYFKTVSSIAILVFPAGVGVAVTADLIVPVLLGWKWLDAIPVIQLFAVYGILTSLQTNGGYVYLALGRPGMVSALQSLSLCILLPLLVWLTSEHGLLGAAWGQFIAAAIMAPINYFFILRILESGPGALLKAFWRPALAATAMAAACAALSSLLPTTQETALLAVRLAILVGGGALVYWAALLMLWRLAGMPAGPESAVLARLPRFATARQEP